MINAMIVGALFKCLSNSFSPMELAKKGKKHTAQALQVKIDAFVSVLIPASNEEMQRVVKIKVEMPTEYRILCIYP